MSIILILGSNFSRDLAHVSETKIMARSHCTGAGPKINCRCVLHEKQYAKR
jgi:hypothetical protein